MKPSMPRKTISVKTEKTEAWKNEQAIKNAKTWKEILCEFITRNIFKSLFVVFMVLFMAVGAIVVLLETIENNNVLQSTIKKHKNYIINHTPEQLKKYLPEDIVK